MFLPVLKQMTTAHSHFSSFLLILFFHLRLGLPNDLLTLGFLFKPLYASTVYHLCALFPVHVYGRINTIAFTYRFASPLRIFR
jgi:hypothetical protein